MEGPLIDVSLATCRRCDYSLRDLPASRCPECGLAFDPSDAGTVRLAHVPRFVQRMLDTSHWRTDRARWASLITMVWGLMLFPGGYYVALAGIGAALVAFPVRAIGTLSRKMVARCFRTTSTCDRRSPLTWFALLLILAAASTGLVTKLSLVLHAPLLNAYAVRVHEKEPFIGQELRSPTMIGMLFIANVDNRPSGLRLCVGPGCALWYDPEGAESPSGTLGARWYVQWVGPAASCRY
jgi:hypothetical protein